MNVWRGLGSIETPLENSAVAIGTFDGVHLGHQALLRAAADHSSLHHRRFVVFTFDRHPAEVLRPENAPPLLTSLSEKEARIGLFKPADLVVARFDDRLRRISPEGFIHLVLGGVLGARSVFVGEGFRFGQDHEGSAEHLTAAQERYRFELNILSPVEIGGERISSSRIRSLVLGGDMEGAERLLGRPFSRSGKVVHGDHLGRKIGYPTANLEIAERLLIPCDGVYAVRVRAGDETFAGACSIGDRPTLGGTKRLVEVYLLSFTGNLYASQLTVEFLARIRGQEKLPNLEALKARIAEDVEKVRALVAP